MPEENESAKSAESQPATTIEAAPSAAQPTDAGAKPAEPTVEDIVKGVLESAEEGSQPSKEGEEAGAVDSVNKTEEKPAEEEEPSASVEAEKGPVPYTRFEEVNGKLRESNEELERLRPIVEGAERINAFLAINGITEEEHRDALDTLALLKRDPKAGLEKLKPLLQSLSQYDEGYVSPELQGKLNKLAQRVEEGELSQVAADDLRHAWLANAKMEAQQRLGQHRGQMTEQERQQAHLNSITSAVSQWDSSKRKTDPDYKPKAKPTDRDGVYELTRKGFMYEVGLTPIKDARTCAELLEKAYNDAKLVFSSLAPKPTKPAPNANRSSSTPRKEPTNDFEVVNDVLRQHGIAPIEAQAV